MSMVFDNLPDESVVKIFFDQRDPQAISYLFKKYLPVVFGISLKYCRSQHTAEDIAMSVFEKLLTLKSTPIVNFKSWLCMVTRNQALEFLRKEQSKQANENLFEENATAFMENESNLHLIDEENGEIERALSTLENELKTLKEDQRVCIELFYFKKMTYQAISDELNIDLKKVKSNIQNGKRNLRILMDQKNLNNE